MRAISVQSYSGYRAEERPISFRLDGKKILVVDILRQWIEEGFGVRAGRRSCFQVLGDDVRMYCLCCDLEDGNWSLRQQP